MKNLYIKIQKEINKPNKMDYDRIKIIIEYLQDGIDKNIFKEDLYNMIRYIYKKFKEQYNYFNWDELKKNCELISLFCYFFKNDLFLSINQILNIMAIDYGIYNNCIRDFRSFVEKKKIKNYYYFLKNAKNEYLLS